MALAENQYIGIGRRKTSTARVYLRPIKDSKEAKITVNNKEIEKYFDVDTALMIAQHPLEIVKMQDKFNIVVTVHGGGKSSQSGAVRHGIARALAAYGEANDVKTEIDANLVKSTVFVDEEDETVAKSATVEVTLRTALRKVAGNLLTRDSRKVQPKKYGFRKARKRRQFSKR